MALQGDLKSFALPDVLRLLAGTAKSGRLEIVGDGGTGEVMLAAGTISAASTSTAPRATDPADVIFDLLRFEDGSFVFDEGEVADPGAGADVEATITAAEALVAEWADVETVVPSMDAWISLAAEIDGDTVTLTAREWKALAAIGGGGNVHDLAAALELTDLDASRQVKSLVEFELVEVRESHAYVPPAVQLDDFDHFEPGFTAPMTDFEDLNGDDRSVVMEEREDALLPEPLPGEGVAYEGETITGFVDGRVGDAPDAPEEFERFEPYESLASFEQEAAMSDLAGEPGTIEHFGSVNPYSAVDPTDPGTVDQLDAVDDEHDEHDDDSEPEVDPMADSWAQPMAGGTKDDEVDGFGDQPETDSERGSLLKFLSSVKP
ncbi:DUF4388 domain-containing protein [Aquihabitans sp. McL0605]|uniref:DUF4388 domain-containing protein n=1 Tax=Aquihabitans sp. McL0605 TaxID=3415671 RepID=UPI003CE82A88